MDDRSKTELAGAGYFSILHFTLISFMDVVVSLISQFHFHFEWKLTVFRSTTTHTHPIKQSQVSLTFFYIPIHNMSGSLCFIFQFCYFFLFLSLFSVLHFHFHRSCYRWKSSICSRKTIARVISLTLSEMIQMSRNRK